jgi:hypothetical protein
VGSIVIRFGNTKRNPGNWNPGDHKTQPIQIQKYYSKYFIFSIAKAPLSKHRALTQRQIKKIHSTHRDYPKILWEIFILKLQLSKNEDRFPLNYHQLIFIKQILAQSRRRTSMIFPWLLKISRIFYKYSKTENILFFQKKTIDWYNEDQKKNAPIGFFDRKTPAFKFKKSYRRVLCWT